MYKAVVIIYLEHSNLRPIQHAVLLLVAGISCCTYNLAASAAAVYPAQPQRLSSSTFVQPLSDSSVPQIVLITNYKVANEMDVLKGRPLQINR